MKATEFCYWLQGYFELADQGDVAMTRAQVDTVRKHLALVFLHDIDPKEPGDPKVSQAVHDGTKPAESPPTTPWAGNNHWGADDPHPGKLYRC